MGIVSLTSALIIIIVIYRTQRHRIYFLCRSLCIKSKAPLLRIFVLNNTIAQIAIDCVPYLPNDIHDILMHDSCRQTTALKGLIIRCAAPDEKSIKHYLVTWISAVLISVYRNASRVSTSTNVKQLTSRRQVPCKSWQWRHLMSLWSNLFRSVAHASRYQTVNTLQAFVMPAYNRNTHEAYAYVMLVVSMVSPRPPSGAT